MNEAHNEYIQGVFQNSRFTLSPDQSEGIDNVKVYSKGPCGNLQGQYLINNI